MSLTDAEKIVTINSRKFDGRIHRSWTAKLLEKKDSLLCFVGEFDHEIKHSHLGVIKRGTLSYEFYWLNRWYNVFRFDEPDGGLRNFYCNLSMPPIFKNDVLDYVDLDVDVLIWQDFSYQILDLEEFEENSAKFNYPKKVHDKADKSLIRLIKMIEKRSFPFS